MAYQAIINLDYTDQKTNEWQRLQNALGQLDWRYAETSALTLDDADLEDVRETLELLARAIGTAGTLSALTLHVQLIGPAKPMPNAGSHGRALDNLRALPLPSEDSN